ncbi:probable bacterial sugar transferase [Psychrobacter arcticus 273-4]|uniref:Probable bacterial sugar transferase n=1 Tax=Psychrobacter arcticus (strain DSM 17307 / VKM B-2377 / 273-4) TaxID=259536 RepID=Q4FTX8_PSYA2|nr:sugar transferase [Psychrobacter arcticus]AAZ18530.1 probable bacterial sugar transferase [Psychrobacter arcticus 273-4]
MFNRKTLQYLRFLPVQLFVGLLLCTWIPYLFFDWNYLTQGFNKASVFNILTSGTLTLLTLFTLNLIRQFPGITSTSYILPVFLFWFAIIFTLATPTDFPFSLTYYYLSSICLFSYLFIVNIINGHYQVQTLAYIPVGRATDMPKQVPSADWMKLDTTNLEQDVSGIVTDLHSDDLTDDWQKFIANKTLEGIPVYHYRNIRESLTGRVRINHMYENELGSLLPCENYMLIKYCLDFLIILILLPFTLIICLLTAIAIKREDGGKVFYVQSRVGYRGKPIKVYKFRSMRENAKEILTVDSDDRITKVGKFIRKTRVDELPQFINVIKGEMSLIGPRAEFIDFAVKLEKQVPFFNYRHIVKPGISGWAQVNQGYATGAEETQLKIEYDFYYIKHISFTLDLLIFFRTIHTTLTGFGSR